MLKKLHKLKHWWMRKVLYRNELIIINLDEKPRLGDIVYFGLGNSAIYLGKDCYIHIDKFRHEL